MDQVLFDKNGNAVAYISDEKEHTIYLWDGRVVAYLFENEKIFGWNGRHLGWFIDGVVYNLTGHQIGYTREKSPVPVANEPVKPAKQLKPSQYPRYTTSARPRLSNAYAMGNLQEFLSQGKLR
jgi:hypothetical protein